VNVVVLAGSVAADPVGCRMPSGDEVTLVRFSNDPGGMVEIPPTGRFDGRCVGTTEAAQRQHPSTAEVRVLRGLLGASRISLS
jgi:hypothetical protein